MDTVKHERVEDLLPAIGELSQRFGELAAEHDRSREFPFANYEDLHAAGYSSASVPVEHGGSGLTVAELARTQRVLGRGCAATAWSITMHFEILMSVERGRPDAQLLAQIYRDVVERGAVLGGTFSEPQLGSNNLLPGTAAERSSGGYVLRGDKYFCTQGPAITWFFVNAWIEAEGAVGDFVFHRDSDGYELIDNWDTLGMRATASYDLKLHGVDVPEVQCVSRRGPGLASREAVDLLGVTDVLNSAVALGIADAAFDYAVEFARTRKPGNMPSPIGHLPGIQLRIGTMRKSLAAAGALLDAEAERYSADEWRYRVAGEQPATDDQEALARLSVMKLFVQDSARAVVSDAMDVVGAASAHKRFPLERHYRDVRLPIFQPVSTDRGLEYAGKAVLGIPLDHSPRWMG